MREPDELKNAGLKATLPRLKVLSLTDNAPWLMAIANDINYERVFVEQLRNLASPGDLLLVKVLE